VTYWAFTAPRPTWTSVQRDTAHGRPRRRSLGAVASWDLWQRRHTLLRNYPVIGHLRFILEAVGPELRQYIVTDNDSERPFSRDQRRWVYTSSKLANRYFGFGTDNDLERVHNYPVIKHAAFPVSAPDGEPEHPEPAVPLPAQRCSAVRAAGPRLSGPRRWSTSPR